MGLFSSRLCLTLTIYSRAILYRSYKTSSQQCQVTLVFCNKDERTMRLRNVLLYYGIISMWFIGLPNISTYFVSFISQ